MHEHYIGTVTVSRIYSYLFTSDRPQRECCRKATLSVRSIHDSVVNRGLALVSGVDLDDTWRQKGYAALTSWLQDRRALFGVGVGCR